MLNTLMKKRYCSLTLRKSGNINLRLKRRKRSKVNRMTRKGTAKRLKNKLKIGNQASRLSRHNRLSKLSKSSPRSKKMRMKELRKLDSPKTTNKNRKSLNKTKPRLTRKKRRRRLNIKQSKNSKLSLKISRNSLFTSNSLNYSMWRTAVKPRNQGSYLENTKSSKILRDA